MNKPLPHSSQLPKFKIAGLPFQKSLTAFFILITGSLIMLSYISYRNDNVVKDTSRWINHTQTMLEKSNKMASLIKDVQISSGAFTLTRDTSYISLYKRTKSQIYPELQSLKVLCKMHEVQHSNIDSLDFYIHKLIKLSDQIFLSSTPLYDVSATKLLNIKLRKNIQENINRQILDLQTSETNLLRIKERDNSASIAQSGKIFRGLVTSIIILILTSVFAVGYYFRKKKIAEDSLFESEERYKALINNISEYSISLLDTNGSVLNWNRGLQQIKGYREEEILGKNISVFYPAEDVVNNIPQLHLRTAAKLGKCKSEGWRVRKDHSRFWANTVITALYDGKGRLSGFTIITRDDTYRKKAENEIFKALEKERELNEMKSNFLAMASHEFKTPLSVIVASAFLIGKFKTTEQQEERNRNIRKIILEAKNLNAIIDEFLSVQKLEEETVESTLRLVNLQSFTDSICSQIKGICKTGQVLNYIHHGHQEVFSDEFILQQILTNLISNAIKYSPEHSSILIETAIDTQTYSITVSDSGIGISEKDQQHLFKRFFRASNISGIPGTGLGLYIVKKYAESLNGTVHFESVRGIGSKFSVKFTNRRPPHVEA
ncbi:ATP-binding protein [Desertivirga xinjiangensis]|uniref:ATP-binding protein n=1 Tax=Desertivirga xinjiangensis TaxID=539206 RepID=UPI002108E8A0|nr:ATP-binding protein [Pedobacter xinjiangensis]